MDTNFLWNRPCAALKAYSYSPGSSVSCHPHFFLIKWVCHKIRPPGRPDTDIPAAEGKPPHCSAPHGTLLSWLQFSYLAVTFFLKTYGVFFFFFPSPPPSSTSPFSDLWALLCSRALKESFFHWTGPGFSHHCPAVTPKKGASC